MRSTEELKEIFIRLYETLLDEQGADILDLTNQVLNKEKMEQNKYDSVMEHVYSALENENLTLEEREIFNANLAEWSKDVAKLTFEKLMTLKGN